MEIEELIANAEKLSIGEQLQLVTHLLENIRQTHISALTPHCRWSDIRGTAPYPLMGEDAQSWVSNTRAEADAHREQTLR